MTHSRWNNTNVIAKSNNITLYMDRGRARCEEELRNWIPVRYRVYKTRERESDISDTSHMPHVVIGLLWKLFFIKQPKTVWQSLRGTTRAHQTERDRDLKKAKTFTDIIENRIAMLVRR